MIEATAYILMGGKNTRFGSEKWKAKLGSQIVLDSIWNACSIFKERKLIGKKKPEQINKTFITDIYNYHAPIVGLHTALINSKTNWILVLSCDLPLINEGCLKFIWDSKKKGVDAVVPIVKDQVQPLCSLYNIDILSQLNYSINKQNLSLHKFLKSINTQFINMDHYERSFFNMNTQDDLKKIKIKNKI